MADDGAMLGAAAITGFAVWELYQTYCRMAPTLGELRDSARDETSMRQKLLDADMCTSGLVLIAGGAASWFAKSWVPAVVLVAALGWVSYYHRCVLSGMTPAQIDGRR